MKSMHDSAQPKIFRKGLVGEWRSTLSAEDLKCLRDETMVMLAKYQYTTANSDQFQHIRHWFVGLKSSAETYIESLIQRKENNIFKKTAIVISGLFNKFKGVTSMTSNYLPTASLILTVDEIERGAKMKYGFLLKHEKIIWSILEHLGLLCVCIYNPELQTCSFYFNGFKKPLLVPISQMKSDNSDPNAEMAKVMNTMLKRGIM